MEDSKNALFCEPNAYIRHFNKEKIEVKPIKKVVFSEPYDCMPNFYFNNHFQKGDCDCIPNKNNKDCNKHNNCNSYLSDCKCDEKHSHQNNYDCNNHNKTNFGFDIKSLMPILNSFGNKSVGGIDLNSISSLFAGGGGFDFSKLISNPQLISNVINMFGGKNKTKKKDIVCTEYEIKNYTKV